MTTIIGTLPYTLTNGTTADANQVQADLNAILSGVNTNAAHNGANSDITSLNGLTEPITVPQGGTGLYQFGLLEGARGCLITYTTTTFTVASGVAAATDGSSFFILPSAITKTLASWAAGNNAGSIDTGALAINTWYTVWGLIDPISNSITGDICISAGVAGAAAPTLSSAMMTAGYSKYSRLGAFMTNSSSQIIPLNQYDDDFSFVTPINDNTNLAVGPTTQLVTLSGPVGIKIRTKYRVTLQYGGGAALIIQSPDETTQAPNTTTGAVSLQTASANGAGEFQTYTNISSQVKMTANASGSSISTQTLGWTYPRGRP